MIVSSLYVAEKCIQNLSKIVYTLVLELFKSILKILLAPIKLVYGLFKVIFASDTVCSLLFILIWCWLAFKLVLWARNGFVYRPSIFH